MSHRLETFLTKPKLPYCRLCLCADNDKTKFEQLFSVFTSQGTVADTIQTFVDVTFLKSDRFSKEICLECWEMLVAIRKFKYIIESSDATLKAHSNLINWQEDQLKESQSNPNEIPIKNEEINSSSSEELDCANIRVENSNFQRVDIKIEEPDNDEQKIDIEEVNLAGIKVELDHKDDGAVVEDDIKIEMKCMENSEETKECIKNEPESESNYKNERCEICNKTFRDELRLYFHKRLHESKKSYKCPHCGKEFSSETIFQGHIRRFHVIKGIVKKTKEVIKEFQCGECPKTFETKMGMKRHVTRVHNKEIKRIKQLTIAKGIEYNREIKRNKQIPPKKNNKPQREIVYNEAVKCPKCEVTFKTNLERYRHLKSHFNRSGHFCKICGVMVTSRKSDHMKYHTKPNKCHICDESFSILKELKTHLILHTQTKSYPCDMCDKVYPSSSSLSNHKRTHSDTKPFKCDLCDKEFYLKYCLQNHRKNIHS